MKNNELPILTSEELLKPHLPEELHEIPGRGFVRIRGLSRAEVFALQKLSSAKKGIGRFEQRLISLGMVEPAMTEDGVLNWQQSAPAGELDELVDRIRELSGIKQGADKSGVRESGDES